LERLCSESTDNLEIKSSTVDTLRSEFHFDETLEVIQNCSNRSSCKSNLDSIGLKQIFSQVEGEMHTEGYFKSPDDQIIGYTIRFLNSDGKIAFVDALVNPLVVGSGDKIENLIRDSYDEIDATTENDASLYWLGRFPLGNQEPTLKIMLFREKKKQEPETSLRYGVSY